MSWGTAGISDQRVYSSSLRRVLCKTSLVAGPSGDSTHGTHSLATEKALFVVSKQDAELREPSPQLQNEVAGCFTALMEAVLRGASVALACNRYMGWNHSPPGLHQGPGNDSGEHMVAPVNQHRLMRMTAPSRQP